VACVSVENETRHCEQLRSELRQIGLAVLNLLLVAVEWGFHLYLHGTI
jgi:hypothetical protein